MSFYKDIIKEIKKPNQVRGSDKAKNISPVLGNPNPVKHPFNNRFVGGESAGQFNVGDRVVYKGQPAEIVAIDGTAATVEVPNWKSIPGMVDARTELDPASRFLTLAEADRAGSPTRQDKPKMYAIYTDGVPSVKYADKAEAEATANDLRKEFPSKKVEIRITEKQAANSKVVEQELMEGPEERIKANPAYVNGVMQHLMHDATVPVSIEHQIGLRPDPQKIIDVWLKYLDKLNATGHDGIPMSTNKKYHEWLTRIYAQKATPFEDIDSRAAQALYQHEVMRRRNLLKPEHTDVNRFGSVSQLEHVMDRLYRDQLRKVLEDEKMKEIIKNAKAVHLVSNDAYDIYIPLNRGAGVKYGKGTRWCTASTGNSHYYDRYSRQGFLYIIMPKGKGDEDKYQFHLESDSFMDAADSRASWEQIRRDFPNLKKDVMAGLAAHPELNLTPEDFNAKIKGGDRWYGLRRYFDTIEQNENN